MHAKSILAILTTVAACGVSVMAGPIATVRQSPKHLNGLKLIETVYLAGLILRAH